MAASGGIQQRKDLNKQTEAKSQNLGTHSLAAGGQGEGLKSGSKFYSLGKTNYPNPKFS